jgi:hypothetical protein
VSHSSKYSRHSHIRAANKDVDKYIYILLNLTTNSTKIKLQVRVRYVRSYILSLEVNSPYQIPGKILKNKDLPGILYLFYYKYCKKNLKSLRPKSMAGIFSGCVAILSLGPLPSIPYPHTNTSPESRQVN